MDLSMPGGKRLSPIRQILSGTFFAAMLLGFAPGVRALEVLEASWGFDGNVVMDTFNPLNVVVRNNTGARYDGDIRLVETSGTGMRSGRIGGIYVEPCYLEPGAMRLIQFYPKVSADYRGWRLQFRGGVHALPQVRDHKPATVRMVDGDASFIRSSPLFRDFMHQRFPTTVGATDGLWGAVLNYVPEFSPAQRSAFIDWLKAGGQLHLFKDTTGEHPEFQWGQQPLELPADSDNNWLRVGYGRVFWHEAQLEGLTEAKWQSLIGETEPTHDSSDNYYNSLDGSIHPGLESVTRLRVAWPLVYLAALVYIAILGPGHYLWARRKTRDYRVVLVVLIGSFALFSYIFAFIGRRGYGERTTVSTAGIARHIEGNRYDVMTWANVFVTSGDDYELKHPAKHSLYATGESYDAINAQMHNGRGGSMTVEIPIFSSKQFVHRGSMMGPAPPVLKESSPYTWGWPEDFEPIDAWVDDNGRISDVNLDHSTGTMSDRGQQRRELDHIQHHHFRSDGGLSDEDVQLTLQQAAQQIVARELALVQHSGSPHRKGDDPTLIDLFVMAKVPSSFQLPDDPFDNSIGYVVYHFSYPK